jgi:hypothetical protein
MCDIRDTSGYLDATVIVNFKDAEGDSLTFFRSVLYKFFLVYRCHNTEHVHVLLSQYRTHTRTAVTIQNMYTYCCHNTEHVHVLLSQYKTYVYYLVLQILIPAFGILSSGMF